MSVLLLTMGPQLGITADLPVVGVGGAGVIRFRAIGASGPVKWTLVDSTLPAEWDSALNPDGNAVTLTTSDADTAGTFSVTVRAVDSARIPVVRSFDVRVMALPLTISGAFPSWRVGVPVTGALTISGGVPPYSGLAITAGALPAGVSLAIVGNQIVASGTPSVAGPWAATVQVSDAASSLASTILSSTVFRLWTPDDLPTRPEIHLDWASSVTLVSGAVGAWVNSGALGGEFRQSAPALRPLALAGAINGKRALRFDGIDDCLQGSAETLGLSANTPTVWCLIVSKKHALDTVNGDRPVFWSSRATGNPSRFAIAYSGASTKNRPFVGGRRLEADAFSGVGPPDEVDTARWGIIYGSLDYAARSGELRLDSLEYSGTGMWTSAGPSSAGTSVGNTIGATASLATVSDIDVACVLAGREYLTSADIQRLEGWAAYQCGLQSNLPSDHPYRHTPPLVSP